MKRKIVMIFSMICFLLAPVVVINSVEASNAEEIYYPAYYESIEEITKTNSVLDSVWDDLRYHGYFHYNYYHQYSWVTRDRMGNYTYSLGYYYDYVALLFKGHNPPWGCGNHHYLIDFYGDDIKDAYIYNQTSYNKHDFVFLWACGTARFYPSWWCETCQAYTGMPYSWTRDNNMALDGYTETYDDDDETFLGWSWGSPNFVNAEGCKAGKSYGDFVELFYENLMQHNKNVKDALDSAAVAVFAGAISFANSPPRTGVYIEGDYSYLKVYGNGDQVLP